MAKIIEASSGASQRRIEANRKNSLLSTGPKTAEGKQATGRNAIVHGLRARNILLKDENPEDLLQLRASLFAELSPQGVLESELADQIVDTIWRSRRIPLFERALIASLEQAAERGFFPSNGLPAEQTKDIKLGRVIERFLEGNLSGRLSRYETDLQRKLSRLLSELHSLKRQAEIEIEGPDRAHLRARLVTSRQLSGKPSDVG
jgi:hypothetical protein